MLFINVLILIITTHFISDVAGFCRPTNYCKLCSDHIACNNSGTFGPACPANAIVVDLTENEKNLFVQVHNELRNSIAGGMIEGFSSAVNISAVVSDMKFKVKSCFLE